MRRLALLATALFFPVFAQAADMIPTNWLNCETDYDCAVVKGVCGPAAMNVGVKDDAERIFRSRAADTKCVKKFWEPTAEGSEARCRLGRCELVGKETTK